MDSEFPLLNSLGFGWGRGPEIRFAKKSYSNFQKCPFCFPGHQNDPWILFKKWALVFLMDFVCSLPFLETLIYIYTLALDHTFLSRPSVGPAAISILLATDIAGPTKDRIQGICPRIPSHGRMRFVENPTGFFFVAVLWLWRMGWLVLLRIVFLSMLFWGVVFFFLAGLCLLRIEN